MNLVSELTVTNCHPIHDLPKVVENLKRVGKYVEGQDSEETLRGFLNVIPDSILVAKEKNTDRILGSAYLPFSQIPLIARLAVNPDIQRPEEINEIKRVLYNQCFAVLRERHPRMAYAEELHDWENPRTTPDELEPLRAFGFRFGWDLFSVKHPLRDSQGDPTPEIPSFLRRQTATKSKHEVALPEPISLYVREPGLAPQGQFSKKVRDILHAPVRAELSSGVLANYLRGLNNQKGFTKEKLGLILLINDHAGDKHNPAIAQNRTLVRYLTLLSRGEQSLEAIKQLHIPEEYKTIAKEIFQRNILEIRFDYVHSKLSRPHFGYFREHLFKLILAFKNKDTGDVKTYVSDVDVSYNADHFISIKRASSLMNFSRQDFLPAPEVHEGVKDVDISRSILARFDEFRFWHYSHSLMKILQGTFPSTTPVITAQLRVFMINDALDSDFVELLQESPYDEDWNIGNYLRKKVIIENNKVSVFSTHTTQIGEVFNPLRARTSDAPRIPRSEAELLFNIIARKTYEGTGYTIDNYDFLSDPKRHVDTFEKIMSIAHTSQSDSIGHTSDFRGTHKFQALLTREEEHERAKVVARGTIFKKYLCSLSNPTVALRQDEMNQLRPYLKHFSDEFNLIKSYLTQGMNPEEILEIYQRENRPLLDPEAAMHGEIARLRALNTYAITHDVNLLSSYQQGYISKEEYLAALEMLKP